MWICALTPVCLNSLYESHRDSTARRRGGAWKARRKTTNRPLMPTAMYKPSPLPPSAHPRARSLTHRTNARISHGSLLSACGSDSAVACLQHGPPLPTLLVEDVLHSSAEVLKTSPM